MEKTQKEYYLNEQMKAIQKELGDNEDLDDISELEKKLNEVNLTLLRLLINVNLKLKN